ncbi:MAG: hypothetical protein ACRDX8_04990 [Acidimicrobiales bacterium]
MFTTVKYNHFNETIDFGFFNQAWFLIAHGDLNPMSSVMGFGYIQDHFQLVMWPLALLWYVYPHGVTLVRAPVVVFVLAPSQGNTAGVPQGEVAEDVKYIESALGGQVMTDHAGVTALRWTPPTGVTSVQLPTG